MRPKLWNYRRLWGGAALLSALALFGLALMDGCTRNVTVLPSAPPAPANTSTPTVTLTPTITDTPLFTSTPTSTPTVTSTLSPTSTVTPTPTDYPGNAVDYQDFSKRPWDSSCCGGWETADQGLSVDPVNCGTYYSCWIPAWSNGTTIGRGGSFAGQGEFIDTFAANPGLNANSMAMTMTFDGTTYQVKDNFVSSCPYIATGGPFLPPTVEADIVGSWGSFGGSTDVRIYPGPVAPGNLSLMTYAQAPATFGVALNWFNGSCANKTYYLATSFNVPADGQWHNIVVPLTGGWDGAFAGVVWSSICGVDLIFVGPSAGLPFTNVVWTTDYYFTP